MRKTRSAFHRILVFCITAVFLFNGSSSGLDISHHKLATWSVNQQNSLNAEYDAFKKEVIDDVKFMTVAFSIADHFLVPPKGKEKDLSAALIKKFGGNEEFLIGQSIYWDRVSFENGIVSLHFKKNGKRGIARICNILAQESYDPRWKLGIRYAILIEPEENDGIDEEDNSKWQLPADLIGKTIITLSMEGNIPEFSGNLAREANTKGGLGAYFGDKLEGLTDIGMKGYGFQPGYSYLKYNGYTIKIDYQELIEKGILEPVHIADDAIKVWTWAEDPLLKERGLAEQKKNVQVKVEVYRINRGGTWNYIFMSEVFDVLYPDDRVHRFTQETVFGKAAHEFLKRHDLKPDILHLNEAHTVVAAAHIQADEFFDETAVVYTNHTLVPAGLERFFPEEIGMNVNRMMYQIGLPGGKAEKFREVFIRPDGSVDFCYAAMRLADVINAVSDEHAGLTKRLFKELYGGDFNKEVIDVLNGSGTAWKSGALRMLEKMGIIPDKEELWQIHEKSKREIAFTEVERKTEIALDPDKPTAWALRRLVEYKSQYPVLRFIVHLMCADRDKTFTRQELKDLWIRDIPAMRGEVERDGEGNIRVYDRDIQERAEYILDMLFAGGETINGLGMQVVVGGPEYKKEWVKEFIRWTYDIPELKGRFVIVPNHDINLLKIQAIGADICIHMPRPLEEACGTSDQRTALNGGINIAIDGAGPKDWMTDYDEAAQTGSGFFLGAYTKKGLRGIEIDFSKFYNEIPVDMYEKLAICSRLFYKDRPVWKHLMHNAYMASTYGVEGKKAVTAEAMEQRYARDVYLPAIRKKLGNIEGIHAYIGENEDFLVKLLGPETGTPKLVRIPVEWLVALDAEKTREIKDFLAAFQKTKQGYIELYSIKNRFKHFSSAEYSAFGIEKTDIPRDFSEKNRGNTVTVFPVMKGEEIVTSGRKTEREWNIGDISVEDTIIAPVGWNHNKVGLITSAVFGLILSEIARKNYTEKDEFVVYSLRQYREYCLSQGIKSFDLTEVDLINMAKGDINEMVASLKRWIRHLPIMPVNTEELREAFKRAREILIRA